MNRAEDIKRYLFQLEDHDIRVRDVARWQLASMGRDAVPDLIQQLRTDKEACRLEAAKILGEIKDAGAVDDLVEALLDDSVGVAWAASETLIKYGPDAILPLLQGLTRHFDSERFRRGAFHVLHQLDQRHGLNPAFQKVLQALRSAEPRASIAWAAERAIELVKSQK